MHGPRTPPTNLSDLPAYGPTDSPVYFNPAWPEGSRLRVLTLDETTGANTILAELGPGYRRQSEVDHQARHAPGRFERHSCREEIFVLEGGIEFGDWYRLPSLGYCNHPPGWVHPADIRSEAPVTLLIKTSGPVNFEFRDIDPQWDGREFVVHPDGSLGSDPSGVTALRPWDLPVMTARGPDGGATGFSLRLIWEDPGTGWTTWLLDVPPGWQGTALPERHPGGDELLLLEGDLAVTWQGEVHRLQDLGYFCEPDRFPGTGPRWHSERGARAIRWTQYAPFVVEP